MSQLAQPEDDLANSPRLAEGPLISQQWHDGGFLVTQAAQGC